MDCSIGESNHSTLGFTQKAFQRLTGYVYGETENEADAEPNGAEYRSYGDEIHHNIIVNGKSGMRLDQDYVQVYNNIIDVAHDAGETPAIFTRDISQSRRGSFWPCIYNNTVFGMGVGISAIIIPNSWNCATSGTTTTIDYSAILNNIVTGTVGDNIDGEAININSSSFTNCVYPQPLTLSHHSMNRNFIYDHDSYSTGATVYLEALPYTPAEAVSAGLADAMWDKDSPSPFIGSSGADKYKTTGTYELDETYTIANGGIGGSHPYLSGVTIPSYVVAVDPENDAWVAGVLGLATLSNLQNATAGSDPSWITGDEDEPSTPATTQSRSTYTISGGRMQ